LPLSAGTLCRISDEASKLLVQTTDRIREAICGSAIVHCDETGMRIGKLLHWLHVAATDTLTWYLPHPKRGAAAIDEMGILDGFAGTSVHDGWASYFKYDTLHALCNAHHLRELTFVEQEYGQPWAKEMIELLVEIKDRRERSTSTRFSPATIRTYLARYRAILESGLNLNPGPEPTGKRGRVKKSKPLNLLERLRDHERAVLAFMYDFSVPFDNNQAERDLRMMKVQQKISGTFRSMLGAKAFCIIRSYISTVRKQHMNVIEALQDAFARRPLLTDI
jgi:transposase